MVTVRIYRVWRVWTPVKQSWPLTCNSCQHNEISPGFVLKLHWPMRLCPRENRRNSIGWESWDYVVIVSGVTGHRHTVETYIIHRIQLDKIVSAASNHSPRVWKNLFRHLQHFISIGCWEPITESWVLGHSYDSCRKLSLKGYVTCICSMYM